jgi:Icc-related predicted phosphoesterase
LIKLKIIIKLKIFFPIKTNGNFITSLPEVLINKFEKNLKKELFKIVKNEDNTIKISIDEKLKTEFGFYTIENELNQILKQNDEKEEMKSIWITHVPPFKTNCDYAQIGGSKALKKFIKIYSPICTFHGFYFLIFF